MTMLTRLALLLGGLAIALMGFAGCGGSDDEDEETTAAEGAGDTTTISFLQPVPGESTFFYPFFVGNELGYFEDEGVEVDFRTGSEELPLPAFVENRDADVGAATADQVLQGKAQGASYEVVYDYYTKTGDVISVPADSEIESVSDLEGERVGLTGQEDKTFLETALKLEGTEPASVETVTVGRSGPTVADQLESGAIAGYSSGISDAAGLQGSGLELRNITPEELIGRPAASFTVHPDAVEEKRDALAGFMRAWAKATYVGIANPEVVEAMAREAVPTEFETEDVGLESLKLAIDSQTPEGDTFGELLPDAWEAAQEQLLEADELSEPVDIDALLNDEFIEEANDWDRAEVEADAEEWADENPSQ